MNDKLLAKLVSEYRRIEALGRGHEWTLAKWARAVKKACAGDEVAVSMFYGTHLRVAAPRQSMCRRMARAYDLIPQRGVWLAAGWDGVSLLARVEDDKARRKAIDEAMRAAAKSPHGTITSDRVREIVSGPRASREAVATKAVQAAYGLEIEPGSEGRAETRNGAQTLSATSLPPASRLRQERDQLQRDMDALRRERDDVLAELRSVVEYGGGLIADRISRDNVRALLKLPKRRASA